MGLLSGPLTFECFRIVDSALRQFGPEQIEVLEQFAIGRIESTSTEQADVGFLGGNHLFDRDFALEKNVIGDVLQCAVRIDTNQIPAAVRKAWLQMEMAGVMAENPDARPTKAQRQQAKEAVEARCEEEARSGRFRRMQQFPVLWDARENLLYFGGTSTTAGDLCADLFARAFDLELSRFTAGKRAEEWAADTKHRKALDEIGPAAFHADDPSAEIAWWNHESGNYDFLGHEFLLWLWWQLETQSDTLALPDETEVIGMLSRTLSLECPRGESGKETITAEAPFRLPEAAQAIRSGKLPRKSGLILVRYGDQYDLVLQADRFVVSGARIHTDESEDDRGLLENRIENIRGLHETLDLLFRAFCTRRIGKRWSGELTEMRRWLKTSPTKKGKPAA